MCVTAAVVAGGAALIGGLAQSNATNNATDASVRANQQNIALQQGIYDETSANFAPYREAGLEGFNALSSELGLGPAPSGYDGFQATPGYEFAFNEGQRAIEGSAAAGGNLRSGATMKALNDYGQGMANQEYGNHLSRLGSFAQMGQAAAGNQAAAAQNFGNASGNALNNIGNAQAAGAIAQGNMQTGMVNNLLNAGAMGYMMGGSGGLFGGNSWGM